ncbi:glycine--tRNA ligase subunit alpha [Acetobacteraceae bacterium]|nr:glycine--tRNA ligase subunit alpha [Acetobacteraceae bacterium]
MSAPKSNLSRPPSFQELTLRLQTFWAEKGCVLLQPYDMEVGAGTLSPHTALRALGDTPWKAAYVQSCRRPADGRYGENPNRLQHYYQFQVLLKPSPEDSQALLLESYRAIGIDTDKHDIRFVEDDWENPSIGAWGLGWEVWCDGMEVTQFTYFQQVGGIAVTKPSTELTYGLERLAMYVQGVENVYDLDFNGKGVKYGDIFKRAEQDYSKYNFEHSNPAVLQKWFEENEAESTRLSQLGLAQPAYDYCLKASHIFNLLDARGVISPTQRAAYIGRIRTLAKAACEAWLEMEASKNG